MIICRGTAQRRRNDWNSFRGHFFQECLKKNLLTLKSYRSILIAGYLKLQMSQTFETKVLKDARFSRIFFIFANKESNHQPPWHVIQITPHPLQSLSQSTGKSPTIALQQLSTPLSFWRRWQRRRQQISIIHLTAKKEIFNSVCKEKRWHKTASWVMCAAMKTQGWLN